MIRARIALIGPAKIKTTMEETANAITNVMIRSVINMSFSFFNNRDF